MLDQVKPGDKIRFKAEKVGGHYAVTEYQMEKRTRELHPGARGGIEPARSAIIAAMRRFIASLLLVLLATQSAFASAAHCATEGPDQSSHFAHHADSEAAPAAAGVGSGTAGTPDTDCAFCHLGSMQAQPPHSAVLAPPSLRSSVRSPPSQRPQHPQEPSDRPPRTDLA